MSELQLSAALGAIWDIVARANRYLVQTQPWVLAKDESKRPELETILYTAAETLRILALLVSPVMPGSAERMWGQLGILDPLQNQRLPDAASWGGLTPGLGTSKGEALFPRLSS